MRCTFHRLVPLVVLAVAMDLGCELVVASSSELSGGGPNPVDGGERGDVGAGDPSRDGAGDGLADAGGAAPTQQTTAEGTNTRTLAVSLPKPPANGSALILVAASSDSPPVSVSGGGLEWTQYSGAPP